MPNNIMVKYTGPKKRMHVPFPADNQLPLWSMSDLDEVVTFERGQGVELLPERAEALLARSPGVFKIWGPSIKPKAVPVSKVAVTTLTKDEDSHVKGDQDSPLEVEELTDHHSSDGAGV